MDPTRHCAQCGAVLSVYALEGVCGHCLLKPALQSMTGSFDDTEGKTQLPEMPEKVTRFGDYELLEEIARGGMGIVYRARQIGLDRIVAIKMLLAGHLAGKDFVQRFRTEAAAAASLQHPNIVAIHEVGFAGGQHFFAMDYIEGLTLAQLVAHGPLPAQKAATYLKTVAEAIHFAHERNVLHRDLKPSNVIVDSAKDQPRVTDFGLAKRLESRTDLTLSGQLLGSPNYVSPEQAAAKRGTVGKRSDVYSLGAILYHLLTGRPPFQGDTLTDILRQLADNEPLAPCLLIPRIPRDLETICLKCLEKEPARRYQTAQELARDLDHFLRDEPIRAHPVSRVESGWRWCRRKPALAALILALQLVFALGLMGVLWQWRHASVSESLTRRNLYTSDMNRVYQAWEDGNLQLAEELLQAHVPQSGKENLRGFEWHYLSRLCRDESRITFTNINFVNERDESRGHHGLALAFDDNLVIAASDNTLKWLDWRRQREAQATTVGAEAVTELSMAMNLPGLVAYRTDRVNVLSPTGTTLLGRGLAPELGGEPVSGAFALSWDGSLLAISSTNQSLLIFDVKTGNQIGPAFDLGDDISSLAFSPDASFLACGTLETKIHILKAPVLKRVNVLTNNTAFVTRLVFDHSGKLLASGANDSHIRIWTFPECALIHDLTGHHGMIGDLAFSPDGRRLASGGTDHTVSLWGLGNSTSRTVLHGHRGAVKSVLFSRDGNLLFTGSEDQTVKGWDTSPQQSTNILRHAGYTADVTFSPDGTLLAVADFTSKTAVLWRVSDQRWIGDVGHHFGACTEVRFSHDGKFLATVGDDTNVQIWGLQPLEKFLDFPAGGMEASVAFHPKGPILAVGCGDIRFCDLQKRAPVSLLENAPTNDVAKVTFSPDGNSMALGMDNGQVSIWDFRTGRRLYSFHEHSSRVSALCFSHNGSLLASGGFDHKVIIYDVRRLEVTASLDGHQLGVYALAFAPDAKTLVSTSWDGNILFWSVANHQVALTLAHDGGPVTSVAFSPAGNLMATSGADRTVRLWPAAN